MARKGGKDRGILEWPPRSRQWWARLWVNGRERRYRADNKTQAKALYGRLKADLREETYFPEKFKKSKDMTLRVVIDRYLTGSTNRSLSTEKIFGEFWKGLWGNRIIEDITADDCRHTQAKLKSEGEWKPATINRYFAFLRHVLMLAMKDGKLTNNPVTGVKFFPESHKVRYFTDDELRSLHEKIHFEDWKLVAFAIETGLRRSEQFGLRWEHISFESQTLTIPMTKSGKTRHVPLSVILTSVVYIFLRGCRHDYTQTNAGHAA
jgi:integrase